MTQFKGQIPVYGEEGQEKLWCSKVAVMGTGRVGMDVIINAAKVGIGHVFANDPQFLERDNLGHFFFAGEHDLGKPKVHVLREFLRERRQLVFEGVVAGNESREADKVLEGADVLVCCAKGVMPRITAEKKGIGRNIPTLQVAVTDGRNGSLGGVISLRMPGRDWGACFGCYLARDSHFPEGEGLSSTVTATLAAIASDMVVRLITGMASSFLMEHNLFFVDLSTYKLEALAVERRKDCEVCSQIHKVREGST